MSYDNATRVNHCLGEIDFGGTDAQEFAYAIKPPRGCKRGNIVDIQVQVTETFNQTTTPGYVRLGTAADPDKYAELNMGAAAITDAYSLADTKKATNLIDMDAASITQVEVVCVAPSGGDPANTGKGIVNIAIDWF